MTYFPDGTPYILFPHVAEAVGALNAAWLDTDYPFPTGHTPPELVARLAWLCVNTKVVQTRGFHICNLCPPPAPDTFGTHFVRYGDKKHLLGSAEIRVRSAQAVYASPTLILHYVADHAYRPPDEFAAGLARLSAAEELTHWSVERGEYW